MPGSVGVSQPAGLRDPQPCEVLEQKFSDFRTQPEGRPPVFFCLPFLCLGGKNTQRGSERVPLPCLTVEPSQHWAVSCRCLLGIGPRLSAAYPSANQQRLRKLSSTAFLLWPQVPSLCSLIFSSPFCVASQGAEPQASGDPIDNLPDFGSDRAGHIAQETLFLSCTRGQR